MSRGLAQVAILTLTAGLTVALHDLKSSTRADHVIMTRASMSAHVGKLP